MPKIGTNWQSIDVGDIISFKYQSWQLLERIGTIQIRDLKNEIYRVQVNPKFLGGFGAREKLYKELKMTPVGKKAEYRSYLYSQARKSSVFYEPIKLPKDRIQLLSEELEIESKTRRGRGRRE